MKIKKIKKLNSSKKNVKSKSRLTFYFLYLQGFTIKHKYK